MIPLEARISLSKRGVTIAGHDVRDTFRRANGVITYVNITERHEDHTASIIISSDGRGPPDIHVLLRPHEYSDDPLAIHDRPEATVYLRRYEDRIRRLTADPLLWRELPAAAPEVRTYAQTTLRPQDLRDYQVSAPATTTITYR
jgi:hypothetical protein